MFKVCDFSSASNCFLLNGTHLGAMQIIKKIINKKKGEGY